MEHEILDLIDRYWKFDDDQTPVSNWHDKQDLLEAVRKALHIHGVVLQSEQLKAFLLFIQENSPNYRTKQLKPDQVIKAYLESL